MTRSPDNPLALGMRGVSRRVPAVNGGGSVQLLEAIDLDVERGGLLHIVGPSGSGKSTLLRLVNRLDDATAGTIDLLGRPIADWPVRQLRRRVAMMMQEPTLLGRTVGQNLRLPFELHGEAPDDLDARINRVLQQVGLDEAMFDHTDAELSVGQKQRVALGRAIIAEPDVLLLDEPTSSLDPRTAEALLDRLIEVQRQTGLTVMMVTHRLSEARRVGGDLVVLMGGRIAASGPIDAVLSNPPSEQVRRFIHGDDDAGHRDRTN